MAVKQVIYANDERLRQKAKKIRRFTANLKQLAEDMLQTMHAYHGLGLAGPQIGVMERIFVAQIPLPEDEEEEPHPESGKSYVLINPKILRTSKNLVEGQEGCLSIPTWYGLVERPDWIEVKAQDVDGHIFRLKATDLLARIFMHEIDHLNGVLFIDHIKEPEKLWQVLPEDDSSPSEAAEKAA